MHARPCRPTMMWRGMTEKCEDESLGPALPWQSHLKIAIVVSVIYVWSYFMTVAVVAPIQGALLPSVLMSLLFLPHGVRVLSAWIYGWRSVWYLLPGAVGCHIHFLGSKALEPQMVVALFASLVASPLAFAVVRLAIGGAALKVGNARLQTVVLTGFLASFFNLSALKAIYGLPALEGAVIFVGDASGLIVSVMIVWTALRWAERRRQA